MITEPTSKENLAITPLHQVCKSAHTNDQGYAQAAALLTDHGIPVDGWEPGCNPLWYAVQGRCEDLVNFLLDNGANVNGTLPNIPPIVLCNLTKFEEGVKILQILLDRGANIDAQDPEGWAILHKAARETSEKTTRMLVKRGAKTRLKDDEGRKPIDLCMDTGKGRRIAKLLESASRSKRL